MVSNKTIISPLLQAQKTSPPSPPSSPIVQHGLIRAQRAGSEGFSYTVSEAAAAVPSRRLLTFFVIPYDARRGVSDHIA